jgi:cardiolipin synthase (CMP-forming)
MSAIDWSSYAPIWMRYLRDQGFALTLGDDLRIAALVQRLRDQSIAVTDVATAIRFYGPVVCRSADDQERLPELMTSWWKLQQSETVRPPPVNEVTASALRARERFRNRIRVLLRAAILGVIAGVLATIISEMLPRAPASVTVGPTVDWFRSFAIGSYIVTATSILVVLVFFASALRSLHNRAVLIRGLTPRDAPSIALQMTLRDMRLFRASAIRPALADLRRHRVIHTDLIDGSGSAVATASAGGFPRLVNATRRVLPEYILLVDLTGSNDILGILADLIAERFRESDIAVERYNYSGDPRWLRRVEQIGVVREVMELDELFASRAAHRILILSDAASFVDDSPGGLRTWVEQLCAWSEPALLSPLPTTQWGPRERALIRRGFNVVEATPAGLAELARQYRVQLPQERATSGGALPAQLDRLLAADPYSWLGDRSPDPASVSNLLRDLRDALGGRAFLYFSAVAVFPTVHPKLIISLGCVLADAQGQRLLNEDVLARLCRIPWLRRGRIPDWLRLALVRDLREQRAEADRVRAAWAKLLEPQEQTEATVLSIDVVHAVHPGLPALVADLMRRREEPFREAILIAFLNDEALPELAVELPVYLARTGKWYRLLWKAWTEGQIAKPRIAPRGRIKEGLIHPPKAATDRLTDVIVGFQLATIPVIVSCVFTSAILDAGLRWRWVAVVIFVMATLADIAKRYFGRGGSSALVKILDRNLGQLLVTSCLLMLAADGTIRGWSMWAAVVIIGREIFVSTSQEWLAELRVTLPVLAPEKWGMRLQLTAVGLLLAGEAADVFLPITTTIGIVLLWLSSAISAYTGWDRLRHGLRYLLNEDA